LNHYGKQGFGDFIFVIAKNLQLCAMGKVPSLQNCTWQNQKQEQEHSGMKWPQANTKVRKIFSEISL